MRYSLRCKENGYLQPVYESILKEYAISPVLRSYMNFDEVVYIHVIEDSDLTSLMLKLSGVTIEYPYEYKRY